MSNTSLSVACETAKNMRVINSEIHLSDTITNVRPRTNAAKNYVACFGVNGDKRVPMAFTMYEVRNAIKRGLKNPEDFVGLVLDDDVRKELVKATEEFLSKIDDIAANCK